MTLIKRIFPLLISLLVMMGCSDSNVEYMSADDGTVVHVGDVLPAFSVTASDGTTYSDASLRGKVAVIVFFDTECGDCRKQLPQVDAAYRALKDNDAVSFITISRAQDEASVATYWQTQKFMLPYAAQSDRKVYNLFASEGIPRIYVADGTGMVRFLSSDVDMPDSAKLINTVNLYVP